MGDRETGANAQEAALKALADVAPAKPGPEDAVCGRVLVGEGTDTWDPVCQGKPGHAGLCEPTEEDKEARRRFYQRGADHA